MKIRSSYVSNSSSSSFIVGVKDESKLVLSNGEASIEFSFEDFMCVLNYSSGLDSEINACSKQEVISNIKEWWLGSDSNVGELIDKVNSFEGDVYDISVSYHDGFNNQFLMALIDSGKVEVLYQDKG